MNFIFLSPNFPEGYWNFCRALKHNNVTTLAIGDADYDALNNNLKSVLDEYYKVSSLENYDEVYRACAYLAFKHGKIDWIESNNEYWLIRDAQLRTDFNVTTGIQTKDISHIKYKSKMKEYFLKANAKVARYHMVTSLVEDKKFIDKVGYPVVVKPDNGVGASTTYKIENEKDLLNFYTNKTDILFIMEEYVDGTILSYDGIAGKNREIIFETVHYYPDSIMDLVNEQRDVWFYSLSEIPDDLKTIGRRVIETFQSNARFFHCEFFRLNSDKKGLGKKGDIIALEVNMRPPGGYIPDMMNYANEVDVYQIWADMICDKTNLKKEVLKKTCCVYSARRDAHQYSSSVDSLIEKYKHNLRMVQKNPEVIAKAMGDDTFIACFSNEIEAISFAKDTLEIK